MGTRQLLETVQGRIYVMVSVLCLAVGFVFGLVVGRLA